MDYKELWKGCNRRTSVSSGCWSAVVEMSRFVWPYHQQMVLCTTHLKLAGWTDWEGFNAFLVEVVWRLNQDEQTFLIFDNSPAHRNADNPGENTGRKCYLPIHPSIKADISRPTIQQRIQDRNEARNQGVPCGEHRQRILLEAAQSNMNTITPAKCAAWYRFMQTYIPRCLSHENIDGWL